IKRTSGLEESGNIEGKAQGKFPLRTNFPLRCASRGRKHTNDQRRAGERYLGPFGRSNRQRKCRHTSGTPGPCQSRTTAGLGAPERRGISYTGTSWPCRIVRIDPKGCSFCWSIVV
ncbi:unnamed protein product, partial [Ectocarpus sp. 12 AP-2014]